MKRKKEKNCETEQPNERARSINPKPSTTTTANLRRRIGAMVQEERGGIEGALERSFVQRRYTAAVAAAHVGTLVDQELEQL